MADNNGSNIHFMTTPTAASAVVNKTKEKDIDPEIESVYDNDVVEHRESDYKRRQVYFFSFHLLLLPLIFSRISKAFYSYGRAAEALEFWLDHNNLI